jgi:hypothetical protein
MAQRCGCARLLLEARQTPGIFRKRRRQHLDRDLTPQARIADAIDLAHASGAE